MFSKSNSDALSVAFMLAIVAVFMAPFVLGVAIVGLAGVMIPWYFYLLLPISGVAGYLYYRKLSVKVH